MASSGDSSHHSGPCSAPAESSNNAGRTSKPPRPLTEKRREQNRRAQRIHREKQKQRRLKEIAGQDTQATVQQPVGDLIPGIDDSLLDPDFSSVTEDCDTLTHPAESLDFSWTDSISSNSAPDYFQQILDFYPLNTVIPDADGFDYSWTGSSQTAAAENEAIVAPIFAPTEAYEAVPVLGYPDLGLSPAPSRKPQVCNPTQKITDTVKNLNLPNHISYQDVVRAGLQALNIRSDLPMTPSSHSTTPRLASSEISSLSIPSPRQSHIQVMQINLMAACLANLVHLGVNLNPGTQHGQKIDSPFYSAAFSDMPLPPDALAASYQSVKSDLRPCVAQIKNNHPLWIDAIPLPTFRQRLLALRACNKDEDGMQIFDEDEFVRDIGNDGMMCWGSGIGSGAPWDRRSWACATWFLKKWWMVTGGLDGELAQQSRWWAEMRGEIFEEDAT